MVRRVSNQRCECFNVVFVRVGKAQSKLHGLQAPLAHRVIPVIIWNHDCAAAQELYVGAALRSFKARRLISAAADKRGEVGELLAVFA